MTSHLCDDEQLVPSDDAQYGTVWTCPVCKREYVDEPDGEVAALELHRS